MKKFLWFYMGLVGVILLFPAFEIKDGNHYPSGAPAGYTGSPTDGKDCSISSCHGGNSTTVIGWITTNIPSNGYTAGTTYNITVSVPGSTSDQKGFEVSPQNPGGAFLGTLIPGAGSKITGTNYITHTTSMMANPAVWTFSWTAPASGSGAVTFYGAFAVSKNTTHTTFLSVSEFNTGMTDLNKSLNFMAYPLPASDRITLSYFLTTSSTVKIDLIDLQGKYISTLVNEDQQPGEQTHSFMLNLKEGIYFIRMNDGKHQVSKKLVIGG